MEFLKTNLTPIQELALEYFTQNNQGIDYPFYIAVQHKNTNRTAQFTNVFLTYSGYNEHLGLNGHHYTDPRPCVFHATRNPEIKRLAKMLYDVFKEVASRAQMERLHQITNFFR